MEATKGIHVATTVRKDARRDAEISRLFASERSGTKKRKKLEYWVKIADLNSLFQVRFISTDRILLSLNESSFAQYARNRKRLLRMRHLLSWALPSVLEEAKSVFYRRAIDELCRAGFVQWHIGHISQSRLFSNKANMRLSSSYTCNPLNSLSVRCLAELGVQEVEFSIETDFENLKKTLEHLPDGKVGLTVYGRPALFTSRLQPPGLGRTPILRSGRGESFSVTCERGTTYVRSLRTFSLLAYMRELETSGLSFVVIDLTWANPKGSVISDVLGGNLPKETNDKIDTFNFWKILS